MTDQRPNRGLDIQVLDVEGVFFDELAAGLDVDGDIEPPLFLPSVSLYRPSRRPLPTTLPELWTASQPRDNLRRMNQREAVIEAMRDNGGYATLGHLYKEALKIPGVKWETKTPFKSINRIVQDPKYFFRIRPGLWALLEAKDKLPGDLSQKPKPESDHTYYQGLLVELGL